MAGVCRLEEYTEMADAAVEKKLRCAVLDGGLPDSLQQARAVREQEQALLGSFMQVESFSSVGTTNAVFCACVWGDDDDACVCSMLLLPA